MLFKRIGGPTFFFTKNNIGSYMKASSTNYKLVFIELINLYIKFWNIVIFLKSLRCKHFDYKFFGVNFKNCKLPLIGNFIFILVMIFFCYHCYPYPHLVSFFFVKYFLVFIKIFVIYFLFLFFTITVTPNPYSQSITFFN